MCVLCVYVCVCVCVYVCACVFVCVLHVRVRVLCLSVCMCDKGHLADQWNIHFRQCRPHHTLLQPYIACGLAEPHTETLLLQVGFELVS